MRQTAFKQQVVLEVVMNYREHHVEDRFFGGELEPLPMLSMKIDIAMEEPLEQARAGGFYRFNVKEIQSIGMAGLELS
jgi:hypothetical protein